MVRDDDAPLWSNIAHPKGFIHLHCHDEYSLLDGFGTAKAYAERVKELNQPAIAITNHGNVDGLIKFQGACNDAGIVPIFGCELYIVENYTAHDRQEKRRHMLAIAKNVQGWNNLLQILTFAYTDGMFYRPRISPQIILDHCEGLIISTACTSSFIMDKWGIDLFDELHKRIGSDLYLELMPHDYDAQRVVNSKAIELAKKYNVKMIATNDCHYIRKGDEKAQEVLLAIQSRKRWDDPSRWKFDVKGLYVKSRDEMVLAFKKQKLLSDSIIEESLNNTMEILEKVKGFQIPKMPVVLPDVPQARGQDPEKFLRKLCKEGFRKRILSHPERSKHIEKYVDRMNEELEIIVRQGFCKYFLIVWEVIHWCRNNDIMVGPGRGSAGGSLICYLLEITAVDPIEFGLLFARFISPARIDLPDIDVDYQDNKRHLVIEHFKDIYGTDNVAGVSTFMTMKGRGALRDVSRVFDVPQVDVNTAAASIVIRSGGDFRSDYTIEDAFNTFEDGKKFKAKYPEVVDISIKLEGQTRGKGQHAAAACISSESLKTGTRAALLYGNKNKDDYMVNWDKHDIEHVGLMKLDILGLNALTVLSETKRLVKEHHGIDIDFDSMTLDDPEVFKEYSLGHTVGCFQFGSLGLRKLCVELGIDNFMLLVHANALFRPGTLRSGMVTHFVQRKKGLEQFEYRHPALKELTKDTFGIILYQEQVMRFMYDLGGLGWRTADTVRKVMSKSQGVEQFQKFKQLFADGCVKRKTLSRKVAEEIWDELSSFGSYGFNLSHAVEYSVISYYDMWCKIHYPNEFICASLTYGSETRKAEVIEEAIRLGLDLRPPKLGKSDAMAWTTNGKVLYAPFIEIKGFGEKTARAAAGESTKAKKSAYSLFNDDEMCLDITPKVNSKFGAILQEIGADCDRQVSDEEAENIQKYFSFSFCRNPLKKYAKLIGKIGESIKFNQLHKINFDSPSDIYKYYFGQITEIRYSYKTSVDKTSNNSSMGGVYGNLKDDTDFSMIVFDGDIYNKKKDIIEHCGGKFAIASCNHPRKKTNISCNAIWTDEELWKADLDGLKLKMVRGYDHKAILNMYKEMKHCDKCPLKNECRSPVLPSVGMNNIMIIGEAPGKDEDKEGVGFVGRSGELLWEEMKRYSLTRNDFHITNVVKCWPSETKTPTKRHINLCSHWIDDEIKNVNPILILAIGNTSLRYILDQESGIMAKNGTVEWVDKLGAWVCWLIHPASVLYHDENKPQFRQGVKKFANVIKIIGGLNNDK